MASETPLLHKNYVEGCPGCALAKRKISAKGAPKKELSFVAFLVLCNALPISSLYPFLYFMVRDFGIAKLDTKIGTYAGYLGAALMLGRFFTAVLWGIVADRFGRKPVLICGAASNVLFNTLFGFSQSYSLALVSRFLLGLCNGTLGTLRAYASEICSEEYQALALSLVGTMWGAGLIIGPALGGYLAQPSEKYPSLFPTGSLFDTFPYALPCLCISLIALGGFFASLFLPESLHNHPVAFDANKNKANGTESQHADDHITAQLENRPLWKNWGMVSAIILYCLWGTHDMAYSEIFSLWAVSPTGYGGLGFSTSDVGDVLAVAGAALLSFQLFGFPRLAKLLGPIKIARLPIVMSIPLVAVFPLFSRLRGVSLWALLISAAILKNILSACVVTGSFLMVNNSVVTRQRGVANGISMSFMSLCKAVGPASAGLLFSWAQERTDAAVLPGMWMVYFILDVVCVLTLIWSFEPMLPKSLEHPIPEEFSTKNNEDLERTSSFTF